jgi:hypothetical protein
MLLNPFANLVLLAQISVNVDTAPFPSFMYRMALVLTVITYLILIIFPRQSWANFWTAGIIVPTMLGVAYGMVLMYYALTATPCEQIQVYSGGAWKPLTCPQVSSPTNFLYLEGLRNLFHKDGLLLAGFLDLLLMPMIVAAWMARKAAQVRMPYVYLLPCIVLTMAVPGVGFWLFVLFAGLHGRLAEIAKFDGPPPIETAPVYARPGFVE